MIEPEAEARAESMGYSSRKMGDKRDSNPYLQFLDMSPLDAQTLADAWWRGWDHADATLNDANRSG